MPDLTIPPATDPAFAREACAAAIFGGLDLMGWITDVSQLRDDYDLPWHHAARLINTDRGIAVDALVSSHEQRTALRAALDDAIAHALGTRSGLLVHDIEAILARPRDTYDDIATRYARDLVEALAPTWHRLNTLEATA